MLKQLRIRSILTILFSIFSSLPSAATAQDKAAVSRAQPSQVIQGMRRPSGTVLNHLPYSGNEILVRFKDTASRATISLAHSRHQASPIKRFRHARNLERVKLRP